MKRGKVLRGLVAGLLAAGWAAAGWAQAPAPAAAAATAAPPAVATAAAPAVDVQPTAAAALQRMSDFYRGLKSLKLNLEVQLHAQSEGLKQELTSAWTIALARPNRLAIVHQAGQGGFNFICDGSHTVVYIPQAKRYLQQPAPAGLDRYFEQPSEAGNLLQHGIPFFATLIAPQPYQALLADVAQVKYLGTEMWQGAACHRVRGLQQHFDWDMWLESGKQPLVRRVIMDMSKGMQAAAAAEPQMTNAQWRMEILFDHYEVNPAIPAAAFHFTPPAAAKQVASFRMQPQEEEGPPPLLGKPAPPLELELADGGGKLSLAKHLGKDVVVLDFWASWCGPCRRSLPLLADVAAAYQGKGVVVYAVNERESAATARAFMAREKLALTVALDADGAAGERYGVESIPQTVVIGKDGTVQAVHVGYAPELKDTLGKQLDELLAGKRLVAPAAPAGHDQH